MRQILFSSGQAVVARMPRPPVAPGSVLVRVRYSLVSTGTETASLRPLQAGTAGVTTAERVADVASRARVYLGKAVRDPRKAAQKVAEIAKAQLRRIMPAPRPAPAATVAAAGPLGWTKQHATEFEAGASTLRLVTDASEGHYQALSAELAVPDDHVVSVALRGRVEAGTVIFGLLSEGRAAWLGQQRLEEGPLDETFAFDPGANRAVTLVIANAGFGAPSRLAFDHVEVAFASRVAGQPVSEMGDVGWNVGYSVAGEVVAVGEGVTDFAPGDLVACAGAGQANHADYVVVKRNLVCRVPEGCDLDLAATTTVGAIALQGVRRAQPQLGDVVAVMGLGLLGMITVQLLKASGARVVGLDLDPDRAARALALGASAATADPRRFEQMVRDLTQGHGADQTIITAASKSNVPLNAAMEATRRKGRVVIVGDVGLKAERAAFYQKEIDLLMSTSYGPGRYDYDYEVRGRDYPIAYVRWTQNRNMAAYLEAIRDGRIDVRALVDRVEPVDKAAEVYRDLVDSKKPPLAVIFTYPEDARPSPDPADATLVHLRGARKGRSDVVNYALVGAGAFGTAMLVPQMDKRKDRFALRAVVSRDTTRGGNFARSRQIELLASSPDDVLALPEIDLLVVATRHDDHARHVEAAVAAGKHVFVEKPLCLTWEELDRVRAAHAGLDRPPLVMVGFNRRFSPAIQALGAALANRTSPLVVNYRLNAGYLPASHWTQGPEGGGRNIGEACHMYDVFRFLAGASPRSIAATAIEPAGSAYFKNDNFVATIGYADGSVCNLVYSASGPKEGLPKERIEVLCGGEAWIVDDFKSLTRASDGQPLWSGAQDKGHFEELSRLGDAIATGGEAPIPFAEILETSAVALHVEDLIMGRVDG